MSFPFSAGKRGAEITTDIADKGKHRFSIYKMYLPLPPSTSEMSGSRTKKYF